MKYVVKGGPAQFGAGAIVKLDKQQASARAHVLEPLKGGKYRTKALIHFKDGEVLDIAGKREDLPRHLSVVLVPLSEIEKAEKAAAADAAKEAAASESEEQDDSSSDDEDEDGDD
jgi:hypothetical protein